MGEKKENTSLNAERAGFFEYLKSNKMLLMAVDPGYDGFKIYINGRNFTSKSLVIKTGEAEDFEQINLAHVGDGTFVQLRDFNTGKIAQYATGQNAREDLTDGSTDVSNFYTDADRFSTLQFRASFYSAVVRALWLYSKENNEVDFSIEDLTQNLDTWKIYLMVTVPYAYAAQAEKNIKTLLNAPVDADIKLSRKLSVKLSSKLPIIESYFYPQVLAAFHGEFLNDFGDYSDDAQAEMQKKLPAILIDAGYHTCAMVSITKALRVLDGNVTSKGEEIKNESFSMEQFDKETAAHLRQIYTNECIADSELSLALVNDYCNGDRTLYASNVNEAGSTKVDVASIREKVLKDAKTRLIQYLDKKFGMKNMHSAFITGGTGGSVMFEYLSSVLKNWQNIEDVTLITGNDVDGADIGSVYGVSYGAYKLLVGLVRDDAGEE